MYIYYLNTWSTKKVNWGFVNISSEITIKECPTHTQQTTCAGEGQTEWVMIPSAFPEFVLNMIIDSFVSRGKHQQHWIKSETHKMRNVFLPLCLSPSRTHTQMKMWGYMKDKIVPVIWQELKAVGQDSVKGEILNWENKQVKQKHGRGGGWETSGKRRQQCHFLLWSLTQWSFNVQERLGYCQKGLNQFFI